MKIGVLVVALLVFSVSCSMVDSGKSEEESVPTLASAKDSLKECIKAGGKMIRVQECDGSENEWCVISEKEYCYVEQVKNGRCAVGQYSKEAGGMIGIPPKVVCDSR